MGIYGNEPELSVGSYVGPRLTKQAWHGQSGFGAIGHEVPMFRKATAEAHLKAMGFDKPGDAETFLNHRDNERPDR